MSDTAMFSRLRNKFVAIVMTLTTIVLVVAFGSICFIEYQRGLAELHETLDIIIDNASRKELRVDSLDAGDAWSERLTFSEAPLNLEETMESSLAEEGQAISDGRASENEGNPPKSLNITDDGPGGLSSFFGASESDAFKSSTKNESAPPVLSAPRIGGDDTRTRSVIPTAVYKYEEEKLVAVSGTSKAFIDSAILEEASVRINDVPEGMGIWKDLGLCYKKVSVRESVYVAFADVTAANSWKKLAKTLGVIGIITLLVFFVISIWLSNWALKPVKKTWQKQRQFVSDASHDLKTPLTVIIANMSILLKNPKSTIAEESQWIENTQTEAKHMEELVNEMLELAQMDESSGLDSENTTPIDLGMLVEGIGLSFDSVALEKRCVFDCRAEEGIIINGDENKLRKMVSTLFENAFKYVDSGGEVDVELSREGGDARLTVHNSGAEVSEEDQKHLFDRFYRADKARTSDTGGFGLGLAIVKEIAKLHGGNIVCESGSGQGTSFIVTLPIK